MRKKCKIQRVTLKGWVNLPQCGKLSGLKGQMGQLRELLDGKLRGYKIKPLMEPEDYRGSDKVYVYGHYWRGDWADPDVKHFKTLYKPVKK